MARFHPARLAFLVAVMAGGLLAAVAGPAAAHPHVYIEARLTAEADAAGRLAAVTVDWAFDEVYSQTALADSDTNRNGRLDAEEAAALAELFIGNLAEWHYFTDIRRDGARLPLAAPRAVGMAMAGERLAMRFTLPLAEPADPRAGAVVIRAFDPSYYVAIDLAETRGSQVAGSLAAGCALAVEPGPGLAEISLMSEQAFAAMPEPGDGDGIGGAYATAVILRCP